MARAVSFVSILGRLNPAIYDVIFPHGPIVFTRVAAGLHDRVSAVALVVESDAPEVADAVDGSLDLSATSGGAEPGADAPAAASDGGPQEAPGDTSEPGADAPES